MIERADTLQTVGQRRYITGVADIGITTWLFCGLHQSLMGNLLALVCGPSGTSLNIIELTDGDAIEVGYVTTDMRQ